MQLNFIYIDLEKWHCNFDSDYIESVDQIGYLNINNSSNLCTQDIFYLCLLQFLSSKFNRFQCTDLSYSWVNLSLSSIFFFDAIVNGTVFIIHVF